MMSDKLQFVVAARQQLSPTDDKPSLSDIFLNAAPLGLGYLSDDLTKLAKAKFLV